MGVYSRVLSDLNALVTALITYNRFYDYSCHYGLGFSLKLSQIYSQAQVLFALFVPVRRETSMEEKS